MIEMIMASEFAVAVFVYIGLITSCLLVTLVFVGLIYLYASYKENRREQLIEDIASRVVRITVSRSSEEESSSTSE